MVITVRIIVKVIIVAIFAFVEIAIFANATVSWLEGREANKPRIRWKNKMTNRNEKTIKEQRFDAQEKIYGLVICNNRVILRKTKR